ncbi:MAG TPA: DEAD/DEAH box helicase family protein [Candidatus Saccharimonadales bacterium]|jgi:superfamily II DNA or RNA helicase|nr:DEAD/DEAH box helicase family protein [Candidatus Saccharimonadales bacterium]
MTTEEPMNDFPQETSAGARGSNMRPTPLSVFGYPAPEITAHDTPFEDDTTLTAADDAELDITATEESEDEPTPASVAVHAAVEDPRPREAERLEPEPIPPPADAQQTGEGAKDTNTTVEQTPPAPEAELDVAEAERLLGYPIAPTPGLPEGEYDERRAIAEKALRAKDALRDDMARAASAAGIDIPSEELAAWQPNDAELDAIHERLEPDRIRARMLDGYADFIADGKATTNAEGTPLRPHQQDMVKDIGYFMLCAPPTTPEGGKAGHINGPPGIGKTGVISAACAGMKYNENPDEPVRIIVIENTINVMHQTHGQDGERGFGKFAPHLDVGLRYTDGKTIKEVTLMPAASFNYLMERGEMPAAHVVIADEGDVYASGTTGDYLREYSKDKILLGLSATIDDATRELMPYEIYKMSVPEGIQGGLLAPTTAEVLRVEANINYDALPEDPAARREIIEAAELRARIEDMKPRVRADIEAGRGVLVRCPAGNDIDVAKVLAKELREMEVVVPNDGTWPAAFRTMPRQIRAMEIGGKAQQTTAPGQRLQQAAFKRFDAGTIDVFLTVKAIGRGKDNPLIKSFYDLDTGGSWRDKHQAAGRASRLTFDERGNPVEAHLTSYYDPRRPDQYTGVQMLGGEPGQDSIRVGHYTGGGNPPRQSKRTLLVEQGVLLRGSTTQTIETRSVTHDQVVELVPPVEVASVTDVPTVPDTRQEQAAPAQQLNFSQAAARLGVSSMFLSNLYETHGYSRSDTVTPSDLGAMVELSYPDRQQEIAPPPVPATGYVSDRQVLELSGLPPDMTPIRLRLIARYRGFDYTKFLGEDGVAAGYFPVDSLPELLENLRKPFQPRH